MFKALYNWWYRDRIAIENLATKLTDLEAQHTAAEQELTIYRQKEDQYRQLREGPDPWVEIVGTDYSSANGIQIKLDWNDPFIKYLRDSGFEGSDDDTVVQRWLAGLSREMASDLEDRSIERHGATNKSEFS